MTIAYRLYPNGRLVSEDSFAEVDNELPYYDDYHQTEVPAWVEGEDGIVCYIGNEMRGRLRCLKKENYCEQP